MEQQGTWKDLLSEFAGNPLQFAQEHWHWMIGILVLLFALSKLNNYLEVTGVNKAILLTRGVVGSLMAFIITPIAFLLLLNFIAWANGLPLINMWNIWEWIKLTGSSFWWLFECLFDFGEAPTSPTAFNVSSVIRLLWVGLPLTIIWWRSTSTRFWKLMIVPILVGLCILTANRAAPPTFLDHHVPENVFSYFKNTNTKKVTKDFELEKRQKEWMNEAGTAYQRYRKPIFLGLLGILGIGFFVGYKTEYKAYALILIALAIAGFYYMINHTKEIQELQPPPPVQTPIKPTYTELDKLYQEFEREFNANNGESSIKLSKTSFKIHQILKEKNTSPPDKFCKLYKPYFFDYCK